MCPIVQRFGNCHVKYQNSNEASGVPYWNKISQHGDHVQPQRSNYTLKNQEVIPEIKLRLRLETNSPMIYSTIRKLLVHLPMPFLVNLLEVDTFLNNAAVSGKKIHVAVRRPPRIHGRSQCTYDENVKRPVDAFVIRSRKQNFHQERCIEKILHCVVKTSKRIQQLIL